MQIESLHGFRTAEWIVPEHRRAAAKQVTGDAAARLDRIVDVDQPLVLDYVWKAGTRVRSVDENARKHERRIARVHDVKTVGNRAERKFGDRGRAVDDRERAYEIKPSAGFRGKPLIGAPACVMRTRIPFNSRGYPAESGIPRIGFVGFEAIPLTEVIVSWPGAAVIRLEGIR